jgi:hypothetical protein
MKIFTLFVLFIAIAVIFSVRSSIFHVSILIFDIFFLFFWFGFSIFCLKNNLSFCNYIMLKIVCTVKLFEIRSKFTCINVLPSWVLSFQKFTKFLRILLNFRKQCIWVLYGLFLNSELQGFYHDGKHRLSD